MTGNVAMSLDVHTNKGGRRNFLRVALVAVAALFARNSRAAPPNSGGRLKWPEGTVFLCPQCGHPTMETAHDVYSGDIVARNAFRDLGGRHPTHFHTCGRCEGRTMRQECGVTQAYTAEGWAG